MFQNDVGSALLLSIINISIVFVVLGFLMGVVSLIRLFTRGVKNGEGLPSEPVENGPVDPGDSSPVPEEEMELMVVQAAAVAAYEALRERGGAEVIQSTEASWRHQPVQTGIRPRWR